LFTSFYSKTLILWIPATKLLPSWTALSIKNRRRERDLLRWLSSFLLLLWRWDLLRWFSLSFSLWVHRCFTPDSLTTSVRRCCQLRPLVNWWDQAVKIRMHVRLLLVHSTLTASMFCMAVHIKHAFSSNQVNIVGQNHITIQLVYFHFIILVGLRVSQRVCLTLVIHMDGIMMTNIHHPLVDHLVQMFSKLATILYLVVANSHNEF